MKIMRRNYHELVKPFICRTEKNTLNLLPGEHSESQKRVYLTAFACPCLINSSGTHYCGKFLLFLRMFAG